METRNHPRDFAENGANSKRRLGRVPPSRSKRRNQQINTREETLGREDKKTRRSGLCSKVGL